jgi:hypothetical protein
MAAPPFSLFLLETDISGNTLPRLGGCAAPIRPYNVAMKVIKTSLL